MSTTSSQTLVSKYLFSLKRLEVPLRNGWFQVEEGERLRGSMAIHNKLVGLGQKDRAANLEKSPLGKNGLLWASVRITAMNTNKHKVCSNSWVHKGTQSKLTDRLWRHVGENIWKLANEGKESSIFSCLSYMKRKYNSTAASIWRNNRMLS